MSSTFCPSSSSQDSLFSPFIPMTFLTHTCALPSPSSPSLTCHHPTLSPRGNKVRTKSWAQWNGLVIRKISNRKKICPDPHQVINSVLRGFHKVARQIAGRTNVGVISSAPAHETRLLALSGAFSLIFRPLFCPPSALISRHLAGS